MEQLPLDLLAKVLCCLPLSHHKLSLQVVCKQWRVALCYAASHELRLDDNGIPQADDGKAYIIVDKKALNEGGGPARPLPAYLLKVLPSAPLGSVNSRLAAGGLEHILFCDGIPSQPTTLPNVRTLRIENPSGQRQRQLYEGFTPQRFPSLRQLVLHLPCGPSELPLNLQTFQGLKQLVVDSPYGVPEDPTEVPTVSSVPADCCVMVHIGQPCLLAAKHKLQAKGYTHILTTLWVTIYNSYPDGVERIDLKHLSVFTHLHTVYININFDGYGIKTFMVQNFSHMPANIQTVVCHTYPYNARNALDLVGNDAAEIVLRCDLGWDYKVERGRAWDRYFVDNLDMGEGVQICHIAERACHRL